MYSNGVLKADMTTLRAVPWAAGGERRVGTAMAEMCWPDGTVQTACPRYAARKQLHRLADMGLHMKSAFEAEFLVLENGQPVFESPDYLVMDVTAELEPFLYSLDRQMREAGVDLQTMHTELAPGQVEAVMVPSWDIQTADNMFLLKHGSKEIAKQHQYNLSYMSVRSKNGCGNGLHFNFSIWDKEKQRNMFSDVDAEDKLSDFAKHWVAGLIKHADALTALCCPTVNCYRRLHTFVVPDYADWALDNRTVSYRVKNHTPADTYIENRLPSGLANAYIVMAGTIAAGLDGVENQLACPSKGRKGAQPLPYNFTQALNALDTNTTIRTALGDQFVNWFCALKRQVDLKKLKDFDPQSEFCESDLTAELYQYEKFM